MNVDLLVYALVATLSPLGFAATLAVLASGRIRAVLFAAAFVVAQFATLALLTLAGGAVWSGRGETSRLREAVELVLGALLVVAGVLIARRSAAAPRRSDDSSVLERLRGLGPLTTLAAGALLGVGGPKRLVLTALAATAIAESTSGELALAALYTAVATLLVWAPAVAFVLLGDRALEWLEQGQGWLARNQRAVASTSLVVVGAFAVADSVAALL